MARRVAQADQEKKINCRPENLAKLIKGELIEEREKIESGQKVKKDRRTHVFDEVDEPWVWLSKNLDQKTGKWKVKKSDLEKKDWDEIVELYHKNAKLKLEKDLEKGKEIKEKLEKSNNLQLFCYRGKAPLEYFLKPRERQKRLFWGWDKEKNDILWLAIPINHPALTKIPFKKGQYYLIEGLENVSFCQKCGKCEKEVKLTDKITIKTC